MVQVATQTKVTGNDQQAQPTVAQLQADLAAANATIQHLQASRSRRAVVALASLPEAHQAAIQSKLGSSGKLVACHGMRSYQLITATVTASRGKDKGKPITTTIWVDVS